MTPRPGSRREPRHVHERPADPAEAADRPLEPKTRPHERSSDGSPDSAASDRDPHHLLNNPVGEPDPAADSDPYDPDRDAGDPPPPGRFPGPGPEPDD